MAKRYDVVIVGAGHGGAATAIALRQRGFAGSIALIGEEPDAPYERPPLSKDYLSGDKPFERILIRPAGFWAERDIALAPNMRIVAVDGDAHMVTAGDGRGFGYGTLVWATGGSPRRLTCSGHDAAGVHSIRNRADVDVLATELARAVRIVVIGGGYIGLEAAAVLTGMGKHVTVLEAQDRVLARVAGAPLSRFFEGEHRARGVNIRLGASVDCIRVADGRVDGVVLADGELLPSDIVITGIGIEPAVAPLLAAGAAGGDGVTVDPQCRTSLPDVFAVGDCAAHPNAFAGGATIRLESVQNATDQAGTVAKALTGAAEQYRAVPWFWSNQYDLKLQTVGLSGGHDALVVRGDPAARSFALVYLRAGRIIALDCVNATRDYVQGRKLVETGAIGDPARLADPAVALRDLGNDLVG